MKKVVSLVLAIIGVLSVSFVVLADCYCSAIDNPNSYEVYATCVCDSRSKCILLGCSDGSTIGHIGEDIKGKPLYFCPAEVFVTYTVIDTHPCGQHILDNESDFVPNLRF